MAERTRCEAEELQSQGIRAPFYPQAGRRLMALPLKKKTEATASTRRAPVAVPCPRTSMSLTVSGGGGGFSVCCRCLHSGLQRGPG